MSGSDGLLLLRSALSGSHPVDLLQFPTPAPEQLDPEQATKVHALPDATHIQFPSSPPTILPKSIPTRWQVNAGDDPASPTYPLDALLFAFLHRDDSVAEYIKASRDAGVEFVTVTDRRVVLDWLSAKSGIEGPQGRIRPLAEEGGGLKRAAEDGAAGFGGGEGTGAEFGLPVAKKGRYQPDRADLDKLRQMINIIDGPVYANILPSGIDNKGVKSGGIYKTRETVLRGDRINNFDSVRLLVAPRLRALYEAEKARQRTAQNSGTRADAPVAAAAAAAGQQKRKNNTPIIIISPSSTALITMHNVKRFLEDAVFVESDVARQMGGSSTGRTEDVLQVYHAKTTSHGPEARKARYFVVDSVDALAKFGGVEEAWERVVCVMTTGQEWQFRPYKWSDPKQLFQHVKGIHVQWTTDRPDAKTANWNVTQLKIDRKARHVDKATVMSFWKALEGWIGHNKPNLQI